MLTETEKQALQLAKKVFEHFTHDALPIAREILMLEEQLNSNAHGDANHSVQTPPAEVKKAQDVHSSATVSTIHVSPHALDLPEGIMMGRDRELSEVAAGAEDDQMPF